MDPLLVPIRKLVCSSLLIDSPGSPSSQTTRNCPGPMAARAGNGHWPRFVKLFASVKPARLITLLEGLNNSTHGSRSPKRSVKPFGPRKKLFGSTSFSHKAERSEEHTSELQS